MSHLSSHPPIVETPSAAALSEAVSENVWEAVWPNESATQAFAQQLAQALPIWPGGRNACIELCGQLGAGKTTLVRHLLQAAGVKGRIKSPTYAVLEPHQVGIGEGAWPIWHFDFYRFNDPQEWEDAGFRDIFAGPGLKLMEWPDKVAGHLPTPDWVIELQALDQDQRQVRIRALSRNGQAWLAAWAQGGMHAG